MSLQTLIAIAVALAMDAFAVSIAAGVSIGAVSRRQTFRLAWHFGLFQAMMPVIGWYLGRTVSHFINNFAPWVAFGLLCFIGIRMIREAFADTDEECRTDPSRGLTLVMLAVATSIDALAVGLSMAVLDVDVWRPALVIGIVCALFTVVGVQIGRKACRVSRLGATAEFLGGVTLIVIGFKHLAEHLMV